MSNIKQPILVFGATGQQGGSVAAALLRAGWPVRAFVRDPASAKAVALGDAGAELVQGGLADTDTIRAAMAGVHGVFSVQPSSGQGPERGISDEEEERYGKAIADLAALHEINPEMRSFRSWLAGPGREAFRAALGASDGWEYGPA